jgi:hypothetical protein
MLPRFGPFRQRVTGCLCSGGCYGSSFWDEGKKVGVEVADLYVAAQAGLSWASTKPKAFSWLSGQRT